MKKILLLLALVLSGYVSSYAQTTVQGYVKTKGRMVDGKIVHGVGLSGVSIRIKGINTIMSGKDGEFFILLPQSYTRDSIYIELISKPGYELIDRDILSRPIIYNPNTPLTIVMEEASVLAEEKLAAEKKIRRTLQRQLQEKEEEIESLKEQHELSDEAYRQQLQELYAQQERNEILISEMADHYYGVDYDMMDEFNRRISSLILEGRLTEADSLLNIKAELNSRVEALRQHQEAIAQAGQELEDLAQDYYSMYEFFKMQQKNDSAAYYLELRAQLDTTDYKLATETGNYFLEELADDGKALKYFNRAKDISMRNYGSKHPDVALSYKNIGNVYLFRSNYYEAIEQFNMSKELYRECMGDSSRYVGMCLLSMGIASNSMKQYDRALDYYRDAADIFDNIFKGSDNKDISDIYNNMGVSYENKKDTRQAISYYEKALTIRTHLYDDDHPDVAYSYSNIAGIYDQMGEYDSAINYYLKSIAVLKKTRGSKHQDVGLIYNNLGATYYNKDDLDNSFSYFNQALTIMKLFLSMDHPRIKAICENIDIVTKEIKKAKQ